MASNVFGGQRLFEPVEIQGFEEPGPPRRFSGSHALVRVDHQVDAGADCLAHRSQTSHVFGRVRFADFDLHAGPAAGN
jgi:hypothetical protein